MKFLSHSFCSYVNTTYTSPFVHNISVSLNMYEKKRKRKRKKRKKKKREKNEHQSQDQEEKHDSGCMQWRVGCFVHTGRSLDHQCLDTTGCLAERFLQDGSQWFVVILDMHLPSVCILVETLKPKHQWLSPCQFVPISAPLGWAPSMQTQLACHPEELLPQNRLCCCLLTALVLSLGQSTPVQGCWWLFCSQYSGPHHKNNNNVHLSCAHQCPERSHDTY